MNPNARTICLDIAVSWVRSWMPVRQRESRQTSSANACRVRFRIRTHVRDAREWWLMGLDLRPNAQRLSLGAQAGWTRWYLCASLMARRFSLSIRMSMSAPPKIVLPVYVIYINAVGFIISSVFRYLKRMQMSSHELCVFADVVWVALLVIF